MVSANEIVVPGLAAISRVVTDALLSAVVLCLPIFGTNSLPETFPKSKVSVPLPIGELLLGIPVVAKCSPSAKLVTSMEWWPTEAELFAVTVKEPGSDEVALLP